MFFYAMKISGLCLERWSSTNMTYWVHFWFQAALWLSIGFMWGVWMGHYFT